MFFQCCFVSFMVSSSLIAWLICSECLTGFLALSRPPHSTCHPGICLFLTISRKLYVARRLCRMKLLSHWRFFCVRSFLLGSSQCSVPCTNSSFNIFFVICRTLVIRRRFQLITHSEFSIIGKPRMSYSGMYHLYVYLVPVRYCEIYLYNI